MVLFNARERAGHLPLEVDEGEVTSVAFGPEEIIARGYRGRAGVPGGGVALLTPKASGSQFAASGQGRHCHERSLRVGGQDRRDIWRRL